MFLLQTVHPPAGATALVAATTTDALLLGQGWWMLLNPVILGMSIMIGVAVVCDNVFLHYPNFWL
jgi:CBS domain-containing membrane protein